LFCRLDDKNIRNIQLKTRQAIETTEESSKYLSDFLSARIVWLLQKFNMIETNGKGICKHCWLNAYLLFAYFSHPLFLDEIFVVNACRLLSQENIKGNAVSCCYRQRLDGILWHRQERETLFEGGYLCRNVLTTWC
jgi:hypothetical protein